MIRCLLGGRALLVLVIAHALLLALCVPRQGMTVPHAPFSLPRLRELCVKLMFLHPVDYGRKAEELLWRKVYYEVIQLIKTNKKVRGPRMQVKLV